MILDPLRELRAAYLCSGGVLHKIAERGAIAIEIRVDLLLISLRKVWTAQDSRCDSSVSEAHGRLNPSRSHERSSTAWMAAIALKAARYEVRGLAELGNDSIRMTTSPASPTA